jgi:AbrB family looped-hinge helix DNA binding protein
MKVTAKGKITIPHHIRERLGLLPSTDFEWELRDGVAVLQKASGARARRTGTRGADARTWHGEDDYR